LTISGGNAITNGTYVGSGSSYQSAATNFYNAFTISGGYFSGLQWKAFYGVMNDFTTVSKSPTFNTFQNISRYSGGSNTLSSNLSNVLTYIDYNISTNKIAAPGNMFGFSNTGTDGQYGDYISLIINGYFLPNQTGTWNFKFSTSIFANDDITTFWINDNSGNISHWPPSDTNYNFNYVYSQGSFIYTTTLTSGVYYPIQIVWSQYGGQSGLGFQFQGPGMGSYVYNGTGFLFYGTAGTIWNSGILSSAFATNGSTLTYTQNPYNGSGVYIGGGNTNVFWKTFVNEVGTICGEYIQIQFPQPIKVATYSLKFS
jgi:hypothetical protein